jgi:ATP adenylyltransferase
MKYIQSEKQNQCIFCSALSYPDGLDNLIVCRGQWSFVILNLYPYTSGHLMVVPFEHVSDLDQLSVDARSEMMELAAQATRVLKIVYIPDGFNIGINIGEMAGAGIAEHIHMHIVPRWGGDTNFMSSIAETRVLPEAMEDTYRRITQTWDDLNKEAIDDK